MATVTDRARIEMSILISALAANVFSDQEADALALISSLKKRNGANAIEISKSFGQSTLTRKFNLSQPSSICQDIELDFKGNLIIYQEQVIGKTQILYKSSLPGELQARLAIESAIDRFLEYLQKVHYIVALDESDRHVRVFIPVKEEPANFKELWKTFLKEVAFSDYGETKRKLPGLVQTFIVMLNAVTLSGRGFSTLDVPILTLKQANVLAAWYYAVIRDVRKRQEKRKQDIKTLKGQLENPELNDKDRKSKAKELQDKEAMQDKETKKYTEYFQKAFTKSLEEQNAAWQELSVIQEELANSGLAKTEQRKLQKQQDKLSSKLVFSQEFIQQKLKLIQEVEGNPFKFVQLDEKQNPDIFKNIAAIAKNFDKRATDQINSTRGDIFTQCVTEMYRLLELKPTQFDPLPEPLLTEKFVMPEMRSPGDDSKEFCYSCGVALDPKTARWQVLRFMFERPSQRRQSSSGEGRPHICSSCSALAFASPLKVTEESIIVRLEALRLDSADGESDLRLKIKDLLRMLTVGKSHLAAGRHLMLASDYVIKGEKRVYASDKLGQVQYALIKVASIFPVEVLTDFKFFVVIQKSQPIQLKSRYLLFIKGLIDGYSQSIKKRKEDEKQQDKGGNEEINMSLGDAVRYVEQDMPFLAQYKIARESKFCRQWILENIHVKYYEQFQKEEGMTDRAKLYRDVAALTGLIYPFAESLKWTVKDFLKKEKEKHPEKYTEERIKKEVEREVCKLIEEVYSAPSFCYFATKGDERKTSVTVTLKRDQENFFLYERVKELLETGLKIVGREKENTLTLYANDILQAYEYYAAQYPEDKDWKELTYNLKIFLYTRFPEYVRKLKSSSEN